LGDLDLQLLVALRMWLEQVIAVQVNPDTADADGIKESLTISETKLMKAQLQTSRVMHKLEEFSEHNRLVIQLSLVAAILWRVAQGVSGG
jgi:hypothetical protein